MARKQGRKNKVEPSEVGPPSDQDEDLEPIDVELRNPSVVVSVRLDRDTAQRLSGLARVTGRRVSDLLREAASTYVAQGVERPGPTFVVSSVSLDVPVGRPYLTRSGRTEREPEDQRWAIAVTR